MNVVSMKYNSTTARNLFNLHGLRQLELTLILSHLTKHD